MATSNHESGSPGAYYRRWLRYIAMDHPDITGLNRGMLLAFAWVFADKGDNGVGCFAGNGPISAQLECTRDTVSKYKRIAIDAGWFADTGRKVGRSKVYNIAIPKHAPREFKRVARRWSNLGTARPTQTRSQPSRAIQIYDVDGNMFYVPERIPIIPGDPWA